MEKTISTSKGEIKIKELTLDEGLDMDQTGDAKEKTYKFVIKCIEPKLTIDEIKQLSFREGLLLINTVNEVNGLSDFQNPTIKN